MESFELRRRYCLYDCNLVLDIIDLLARMVWKEGVGWVFIVIGGKERKRQNMLKEKAGYVGELLL